MRALLVTVLITESIGNQTMIHNTGRDDCEVLTDESFSLVIKLSFDSLIISNL